MTNKSALFILDTSDPQNRSLVTSRDIKIGEEILEEKILIFGPVSKTNSTICLGCGVNVDGKTICYDCGWPICKFSCDKLVYHTNNECEIFKKCPAMSFQRLVSERKQYHQYDCILPLRLLLLKERSPEKWKYIEEFNSYSDIRRNDMTWKKEQLFVVKFIRQKCKLKQFDEELIHKICGIINTNCLEISNSKNNIRCIYILSHYFSHSCVPNSSFVILPNNDFKASINISKGEKLTFSKIKVIMPTLLRRQELLQTYFLRCCCERCSDATELESNFSSLPCQKCKNGRILSLNPLDFEADWECTNCLFKKRYSTLKKLYNGVEKELNKLKYISTEESITMCEKLLKKYETKFHFNHAFIVYLKYHSLLMSLNGNTFQICDSTSIDMKIIRLHEILSVFNIISPGYSLLKGSVMYLLYKAFVIKAKLYDGDETYEREQFAKNMEKALNYLEKTEKITIIEESFIETRMDVSE